MEFDLKNNVKDNVGLAPVAIATDTTTVTAIIDTADFGSLVWQIMSGVITDGAYTIVLEESDDSAMSGATAVPAAERLGDLPAFALSEDGVSKRVGSIGKLRYQRLSIVSVSTTVGGLFSVAAIQGHPKSKPVA